MRGHLIIDKLIGDKLIGDKLIGDKLFFHIASDAAYR